MFLFLGDIGGSELMLVMVIFPLLFIIYFIPSFVARKRPDFGVVLLVNILAGWSVIGWFAALYLAFRLTPAFIPATVVASSAAPAASVADELAKLRDLRDQGVLTQVEFERQKSSLLG